MKIVLVAQNSSYTHTNLAIRALRCALMQSGYSVEMIECTINDKGGIYSLLEKMIDQNADLYGFSTYIWNREQQLSAAAHLKKLIPNAITVFGGPEVSYEDESFLNENPYVDYLIKGEGENSFVRLLEKIKNGTTEKCIDTGHFADFELTPEPYLCHPNSCDSNETLNGKLVYYESTRGCPFSCSYCLSSAHTKGKRVRAKSVELTLFELNKLSECGAKTIKLLDRTFNFDQERAKKIFKKLIEESRKQTENGEYYGTTYHFEICAGLLDDETISILSEAPKNLLRFEIGVQSTNPIVLRNIDRNDDISKTLFNMRQLKARCNILLHLDLIVGLTGESFESIRQSFNDVYPLADLLQLGFLKLLSGTKMRFEAEQNSIVFLSKPPYQILKTKELSFEMICSLLKTEKALDLLCSKDGFSHTLQFITSRLSSPFDFFETFSKQVTEDAVTRKKLYEVLFHFSARYLNIETDTAAKNELRDCVLFDFLLHNQGAPPQTLLGETVISEETKVHLRTYFIENQKNSQFVKLFLPACEYHFFAFDRENYYLIDRKNRIYQKIKVKTAQNEGLSSPIV